ncbi:MAG: hypothetical protein HW421_3265 [Ignavibacteria bacterium]|nr:hypothetical protein [Ignavibacteria bacterium]
MTEEQNISKLFNLKPSLKSEVFDFIDFLFAKQKKEIKVKKPQFGCAKGRFFMTNDFDAPLEDLKEYML